MSASRGGYAGKSRDHVRIDELELIVEELRRQLGDERTKEGALIRECDDRVSATRGEFQDARHTWEGDRKQLTDLLQATLERQREFNSQLQDQQLIWDDLDADRAQLEAENQHLSNRNHVLQMQLKAMNDDGPGNEQLDQHIRALIADLKDERQWRLQAEQKVEQLYADRGASWELEDGASRTEQLLEEELQSLRCEMLEFKQENARLQSQLAAEQQGVVWEPPVAYGEFEDKDAMQRENRWLKERVSSLEHRSTLRLPLAGPSEHSRKKKQARPPTHGTGDQLRKYYDNVPSSLLSRVDKMESAWESRSEPDPAFSDLDKDIDTEMRSMHANVSDDYHALARPLPRTNNSLKFDQSLPLARKAAEMETETRIALASAKAMARRMLGDEKGCREYEAIARRLKRQQTGKPDQLSKAASGIAKAPGAGHSTRALVPASNPSQVAAKTASAVERASSRSPPRRRQLTAGDEFARKSRSRSPPPHKTPEWRSFVQDRAYPVR